jgi:hypothetical protein
MLLVRTSLLIALAIVAATVPALADRMSFYMKNRTTRPVVVELYGQDRQMAWPGGDQVYYLEKAERKSVPIECNSGERICWGAWRYGDDGWTWGTGPDNAKACEDCCSRCMPSATETIDLSD